MADKTYRPEWFYNSVLGPVAPATITALAEGAPSALFSRSLTQPPAPITERLAKEPSATPDEQAMPKKNADAPLCIVTGQPLEKGDYIRFGVHPEGFVVADLYEKLPAPHVYVTAHKDVLKKAVWRNSFAGALKQSVEIPPSLNNQITDGLLRQMAETLSLAKRAGQLFQGFEKVGEHIAANYSGLYIVAADAAENGREKIAAAAQRQNIEVLDILTKDQLSTALGQANTIHISIEKGAFADKLTHTAKLLKNLKD